MSSLGEKLRQARDARGVTLSEVAEQTRISAHYLEAIEADDYRNLPGGIFNKGFVKAYAKYVGVDEQEALQDYAKIVAEQGDKLSETELKVNRPEVLTDDSIGRSSILPTIIFAAVILGLMTWGILAALNWWQNQPPAQVANANTKTPNSPLANAASQSNNVNANNANSGNTATNTNIVAPTVAPGEMNIQIKTLAEVAIQSTTDGKLEDITFQPEMVKDYKPLEKLKLRYYRGLADKVSMTINGKAITLPAAPRLSKGNGIEFEINKDNIAQILQTGAITFDVPTTPNANANVANTAPKQ